MESHTPFELPGRTTLSSASKTMLVMHRPFLSPFKGHVFQGAGGQLEPEQPFNALGTWEGKSIDKSKHSIDHTKKPRVEGSGGVSEVRQDEINHARA